MIRNCKNPRESGASLVFALFLMLFLTLISFSLVMLISHETKSSSKLHLSQQALYAAEAGVERKIAQLREDDSANIALTDFFGAQYEVSISAAGSDHWAITSKGYVPSKALARDARAVQVTVLVTPGAPEHALAFAGSGAIGANSTIYGTVRSNDIITIGNNVKITESSPGKGDASMYTSYDPDDANRVTISLPSGASLEFLVANQYIKSRSKIEAQSRLSGTNLTIAENDTSSDTEPLDFPSADTDALLATALEVTPDNYNEILNAGVEDIPWSLTDPGATGIFELAGGSMWDPGGINYNFNRGVKFGVGATIGPDVGSVIVTSGTSNYGIEFDNNVQPSAGKTHIELNVLVLDGEWAAKDVIFKTGGGGGGFFLRGYVYGSADVEGDTNINLEGVVEAGGDLTLDPKVTVTHSNDIPMDLPWKDGYGGSVTIISWQEVSP